MRQRWASARSELLAYRAEEGPIREASPVKGEKESLLQPNPNPNPNPNLLSKAKESLFFSSLRIWRLENIQALTLVLESNPSHVV